MRVKFNQLEKQWHQIKDGVLKDFETLFETSNYILGTKVAEFENAFAEFCQTDHSIGVATGTDALKLAAAAITDEGENVCIYLPINTFVATYIGIRDALPNANFVFIDFDKFYQIDVNDLEEQVAMHSSHYDRNIIVPVHLYGYTSNMLTIKNIAEKYNCSIIEDSSQAHGAISNVGVVGSSSLVSCFSLYPGKNLGAAGDAGVITTNNKEIRDKILDLRNYGSTIKYVHNTFGYNSRLDTIQAIVLLHKLNYLNKWNESRRLSINRMVEGIDNELITLPKTPEYCVEPVHHIFPVRVSNKEKFICYLNENNIDNSIHYPTLLIDLPYICQYREFNKSRNIVNKLVSLPIHPFMSRDDEDKIITVLNEYGNNDL